MNTFIDCYENYKLYKKNNYSYKSNDGIIELNQMNEDEIIINFVFEKEAKSLNRLISYILENDLLISKIFIAGYGDQIKHLNIDNIFNDKFKFLNIEGSAILVNKDINVDEYIKERDW